MLSPDALPPLAPLCVETRHQSQAWGAWCTETRNVNLGILSVLEAFVPRPFPRELLTPQAAGQDHMTTSFPWKSLLPEMFSKRFLRIVERFR